jgi:DNA-binding transcriptional MerR regulator
VQAHVLRYWESEFPMLAPQKNRAGQRVYRKRDVEMALKIKDLLYEDQYTIAGAKKRLANELRGGGKLKAISPEGDISGNGEAQSTDETFKLAGSLARSGVVPRTAEERQGLKRIASELRELLSLLEKETKGKGKAK